ncbi:hypothetical protein M422DRAFT_778516 [Sphaerobolus stellatus SS14]|uniref:3-carboxymuconate cyclase n=1 Tax=Sphaerobolus stellatus (strain SS14) TaxID=990650 RepID=A0A0C9TTI9_SPHS4|nr:hypothetical protein M422DRAFT_783103 [Sphaerobolus stellatus SS14]KIJ46206.1 hypothetical protein M422DRAFT_778516 [Sphaerobolus stellatus SS14]
MKFTIATSVLLALLPYVALGNVAHSRSGVQGAAYFLTNDPTGNYIVTNTIGPDGHLTVHSAVYAGGKGLGIPSSLAPSDGLFSQGSIQVVGNILYTVNAGSNTIAAFEINKSDATKLTPIGKPVNSGGEFPVSVAVSQKTGLVCALNAGAVNGVSCYKLTPGGLVPVPNTRRIVGLTQTTPPNNQPGPNGLSHVIFNEAETQVLVAIREPSGGAGRLAIWDINAKTGALTQNYTEFVIEGAHATFGMQVLPGKNAVLASDPAIGYEIFDFNTKRNKTAPYNITGQVATCWATYQEKTGNVFLIDSLLPRISEVWVDKNLNSGLIKNYALDNATQALDSAIATVNGQDYLYVLGAVTQNIDVFWLKAPGAATNVQHLLFTDPLAKLKIPQDSKHIQGMAIYLTGSW